MKIQIQTKIFTFITKTKIVMKDLAFFFFLPLSTSFRIQNLQFTSAI